MNKYVFDGRFSDNKLVVGHTGCGKTTFVQNLPLNNMFGDLKKIEWISIVELSEKREDQIRSCFKNTIVEFYYPPETYELDKVIENFQRKIVSEVKCK